MQIVHAPTEIAGQIGILCEGLRAKGHHASGYNWFNSFLNYSGKILNTDAYELAKLINTLAKYSDIIHFHNGNTLLLEYADLAHFHKMKTKMVMHHWGNDVRSKLKVKKLNPYSLPTSYLRDSEIHKRLFLLAKYIDTAIVQDYEVYLYVKDYYKNVHILPLACNVGNFPVAYPDPGRQIPKVIHAPTNRAFKGTAYVEEAVAKLQPQTAFIYQTVEKMSHDAAIKAYLEADIVIDQLLCGTYGMLSVEAMAMGKVVVAFIREDVKNHLPADLPIVNAKPETLSEVLAGLINNPARRAQLGRAGREYVMKHHEIGVVTDQLCRIYQQLL
ncbi:MAG: glycosyltransferase family protein [Peptococcaceae bacterium]